MLDLTIKTMTKRKIKLIYHKALDKYPLCIRLSSNPVHKVFIEHQGRLLNILYILNLGPVSSGNKYSVRKENYQGSLK